MTKPHLSDDEAARKALKRTFNTTSKSAVVGSLFARVILAARSLSISLVLELTLGGIAGAIGAFIPAARADIIPLLSYPLEFAGWKRYTIAIEALIIRWFLWLIVVHVPSGFLGMLTLRNTSLYQKQTVIWLASATLMGFGVLRVIAILFSPKESITEASLWLEQAGLFWVEFTSSLVMLAGFSLGGWFPLLIDCFRRPAESAEANR